MKILSILLFIAVLPASPLQSGDQEPDFLKRQKGFIRELFQQHDYFQCIGETRRFLNYGGGADKIRNYELFIYGNYYLGNQYKTVIFHLAENKDYAGYKGRLLLSQSYMKLGYFDAGYRVLKDIGYGGSGAASGYDILVRKIEPLLLGYDYDAAAAVLEEAKPYVMGGEYTALYRTLMAYKDLGYRSTPVAVALSLVIPGAGQAYTGNVFNGLITLLGVAATASGSYYFMKKGERGMGYSFAFFSALFYAGGVYGAYNSSEKFNINTDRNFVLDIRKRYIPAYNPVSRRDLAELFN